MSKEGSKGSWKRFVRLKTNFDHPDSVSWFCNRSWMCSLWMIWIRISDRRSLRSWYFKELMKPLYSSVSLMHHDPSDLGSLILIQITPKERTHVRLWSKAATLVLGNWSAHALFHFCFWFRNYTLTSGQTQKWDISLPISWVWYQAMFQHKMKIFSTCLKIYLIPC